MYGIIVFDFEEKCGFALFKILNQTRQDINFYHLFKIKVQFNDIDFNFNILPYF